MCVEVKDSQLKSFDEADDAAAMASSVMADELATVQEMLKAKENVLSEIDEEMRRLHNEKLELQQKCQSQDHLINNLYRRLEVSGAFTGMPQITFLFFGVVVS